MFGLENMVTLLIGSSKGDLEEREPLKRGDRMCWTFNRGQRLSWERSKCLVGERQEIRV